MHRLLWVGAELTESVSPVSWIPGAGLDFGLGTIRGKDLSAANFRLRGFFHGCIGFDAYLVVGAVRQKPSAWRTAPLLIGGGALFLLMNGVDDVERVQPSFAVGGSFGALSVQGASRFRFAFESRFRLFFFSVHGRYGHAGAGVRDQPQLWWSLCRV